MSDLKSNREQINGQEKERLRNTLLSTLVVCMMPFMLGCTLGYSSPVLLELEYEEDQEMRFDAVLTGVFGASILVGGIIGGPFAGWVADKWGRKISLMVCALPYLLGNFLMVSASITASPIAFKGLLITGRFITGIGNGWAYVATPVYVGEISSANRRGLLSSISEPCFAGGIMFVYSIGLIPTFHYYHTALVLEGVIVLYMLLIVWVPETPRWLLSKGKEVQAIKAVLFLRGAEAANKIKAEIEEIRASISEAPRFTLRQTLKEIGQRSVLIPIILIAAVLMFLELTGGGSTVITYAATIFKEAGVKRPDLIAAFLLGGTQLIASAVAACIIDFIGRKILLLISGGGMLAGSAMLGTHFYITRPSLCANSTNATMLLYDSTTLECNTHYAPLAIVSLVFFMITYAIGWGPVPWVIMSEYLPLRVRGIGTGIGVLVSGISGVLITGTYPVYVEHVHTWFVWWTYSILNLIAIVFTAVFVVETKGRSLEDIQRHFQQKYNTKKHLYNDV